MKHKHYDMIVAKAANVELTLIDNVGEVWGIHDDDEWMPLFKPEWGYFLCLPKYKDTCLHWLNGGGVQVKDIHGSWVNLDAYEESDDWCDNSLFMDENAEIRIKPKNKKRWIGLFSDDKGLLRTTELAYESIEDLKSQISAPRGFGRWQFIEIEVGVE